MGIPDPNLDPITGLPILDTSGIVQQIPLGRQIVDYPGWYATAQPTRNPLSPDDGIPVFANVQGQHPQTGNAQSVQTDGNRALKVYQVNASGSSVGPTPIVDPQGASFFHGTSPSALAIHQFITFPFTIYGFSLGYTIDPTSWSPPDGSSIQVYLQGDTTGNELYLAAGYMKLQVVPNVTEMLEHRLDWPYNAPVQFTAASFPGDTTVTLHLNCANIDIDFSAAFLYS